MKVSDQRRFGLGKFFMGGAFFTSALLLTGCSTAASLIGGEVVLDSKKIQDGIRKEISNQSGLNVSVECPDPMSGPVGESRQCVAEDDLGQKYVIDVTIQNRDGYVVWQVRE